MLATATKTWTSFTIKFSVKVDVPTWTFIYVTVANADIGRLK